MAFSEDMNFTKKGFSQPRSKPLRSLDYSSAYVNEALPVVGFCFQEPENDPRNFVYVWILRGENDIDSQEEKEHSLSNLAFISLYAMAFQNKVCTSNIIGEINRGVTKPKL